MATANELITRALRRLGILAEAETPSANTASDCLVLFNEMMAGFPTRGIHYAHTTLASGSSTVNVPDEQTRNVMLMLCQEIADDFSITIGSFLAGSIKDAKDALVAYYYTIPPAVGDRALMRRTSGYGLWNIRSGGDE